MEKGALRLKLGEKSMGSFKYYITRWGGGGDLLLFVTRVGG